MSKLLGTILVTAFKYAAITVLSQGFQAMLKNWFMRIKTAILALVARYPASLPALLSVAVNMLARFGLHVSATQLALIASAVAIFLGSLVHGAIKTAHKSTSK